MNERNQAMQILTKAQKTFKDTQAGSSVVLPEPGEHFLYLTGVSMRPSEFRTASGNSVQCVSIAFQYKVQDDAGNLTSLSYLGAPRYLVPNPEALPDDDHPSFSSRERAQAEWQRFKSSLQNVMGNALDEDDLIGSVTCLEKILANTAIPVTVQVTERTSKDGSRTFKSDAIQSCHIADMKSVRDEVCK